MAAIDVEGLSYRKNINYAKKGIYWGLIGGLLCGIAPLFQAIGLSMKPLLDGQALGLLVVPIVFGCLQDSSSAIFVLVPNILRGKRKEYLRALKTKPGKLMILCALFGGPIATASYIAGIYFAGPIYPVAVSATFPALGAVLSRIFLKERITARGWVGIMLCVIGAAVVSWIPPTGNVYPHFYLGVGLALIAAIGWSLEGTISCAGMDFIDPEIALGVRELSSTAIYLLFVMPFVAGFGYRAYVLLYHVAISQVMIYIMLSGLTMGFGYYLYYKANNACGVARGMTLNITYVPWAAILSSFFLHSPITWSFVGGLIVLLMGGFFVAGKPSELLSLRNIS